MNAHTNALISTSVATVIDEAKLGAKTWSITPIVKSRWREFRVSMNSLISVFKKHRTSRFVLNSSGNYTSLYKNNPFLYNKLQSIVNDINAVLPAYKRMIFEKEFNRLWAKIRKDERRALRANIQILTTHLRIRDIQKKKNPVSVNNRVSKNRVNQDEILRNKINKLKSNSSNMFDQFDLYKPKAYDIFLFFRAKEIVKFRRGLNYV